MNNYYAYVSPASELYHHGILGQKWGVRRFQNEDGSYTAAGRRRYGQADAPRSSKISAKKVAAVLGIATVGALVGADIATGGKLHRAAIDAGKKFVDALANQKASNSAQTAMNSVNKALNEYSSNRQIFAKRESNPIAARNFRRRARMYFRNLLDKSTELGPDGDKARRSMDEFLKNLDSMKDTFGVKERSMFDDFKGAAALKQLYAGLDYKDVLERHSPVHYKGFRVY